MSGRLLRRVSGITLLVSALSLFSLSAEAVGAAETAGVQGSWNPISFLVEYLSSLLPDGTEGSAETTALSKGSSKDECTAGESGTGGNGSSGEDDGDNGPIIDPNGIT